MVLTPYKVRGIKPTTLKRMTKLNLRFTPYGLGLNLRFNQRKGVSRMTTFAHTTTTIDVNFVNANGDTVLSAQRPLRLLPDGKGFGVVRKGKVLPLTFTGINNGCAIVGGVHHNPEDCRSAKYVDLGIKTKSEIKASQPSAPRTMAQQQATVAMLTASLAKSSSPQTKKALATAKANLARMSKGDVPVSNAVTKLAKALGVTPDMITSLLASK